MTFVARKVAASIAVAIFLASVVEAGSCPACSGGLDWFRPPIPPLRQAGCCTCPDDYCKKPCPSAPPHVCKGVDDYCKKRLPPPPCRPPCGDDLYSKKPMPCATERCPPPWYRCPPTDGGTPRHSKASR